MAAIGMIISVIGCLIAFVGSIMVIIEAFKTSVVWGICYLFVPFAALVFWIKYWDVSKRGVLLIIGGIVLSVVGSVVAGALAGA